MIRLYILSPQISRKKFFSWKFQGNAGFEILGHCGTLLHQSGQKRSFYYSKLVGKRLKLTYLSHRPLCSAHQERTCSQLVAKSRYKNKIVKNMNFLFDYNSALGNLIQMGFFALDKNLIDFKESRMACLIKTG